MATLSEIRVILERLRRSGVLVAGSQLGPGPVFCVPARCCSNTALIVVERVNSRIARIYRTSAGCAGCAESFDVGSRMRCRPISECDSCASPERYDHSLWHSQQVDNTLSRLSLSQA
jgi:hypothetical protein